MVQLRSVNIKASTRGEFDLAVSVWLIDPEDAENEIDAIYDTDSIEDAVQWATNNGYRIKELPYA